MSIRAEVGLPILIGKFRKVATGEILKTISENLSEEALYLLSKGFDGEHDPFGRPWAPIRRKGKILQDTARMKNSFFGANVTQRGFRVATNVVYAGFHQQGTKRVKRRMMLPETELPRTWTKAFEETANEIITEMFKT